MQTTLLDGFIWKGDSGGGGYKLVNGKRRLASINFASDPQSPGLQPVCPPENIGDGQFGYVTTLHRSSSSSIPGFEPVPHKWMMNVMGGKTPASFPLKTAVLGPIGTPSSDWIDITGDGLPEFVSWGQASGGFSGLYASLNTAPPVPGNLQDILNGTPVKLLSDSFTGALSSVKVGDVTGDGKVEVIYAAATALAVYPGNQNSLTSQTFGSLAPLSLPFWISAAQDLTMDVVLVPTGQGSTQSNALLFLATSSVPFSNPLLPDDTKAIGVLFNPQQLGSLLSNPASFGFPTPFPIPDLKLGAESNFSLTNIDQYGTPELAVMAYFYDYIEQKNKRYADLYSLDVANQTGTWIPGSPEVTTICPYPNPLSWARMAADPYPDLLCHRADSLDVIVSKEQNGELVFDTENLKTSEFPFSQPINPDYQAGYPDFWQYHYALADVTSDGIVDYVNYRFTRELWVRPGNGDGTFGPLQFVDVESKRPELLDAFGFNVAVVDRSGIPRITLADSSPAASGGQKVHVLSYPATVVDSDQDSVPDYLDTCPGKTNLGPGQDEDKDNDGINDACDPSYGDIDQDSVADAIDNCPWVSNSDQRNCNAEAEKANLAEVLGDACDPTPCAQPTPAVLRTDAGFVQFTFNAGGLVYSGGSLNPTYSVGGFEVAPVPQHQKSAQGSPVINPSTLVPETSYRYCLELSGKGFNCSDELVYKDGLMNQAARLRAVELPPSASQPWRRISVDGLNHPSDKDLFNRFEPNLSYNAGPLAKDWLWKQDFTHWRATISTATFPELNDINGVAGTLGALAVSSYGTTAGSFGLHGKQANPATAATDIAIGVRKSPKPTLSGPTIYSILPNNLDTLLGGVIDNAILMVPAAESPYALDPSCKGKAMCIGVKPGATIPIVRIPENPSFAGVLEEDGMIRQIGTDLSPQLRDALSRDALFLTAAEPSVLIGRSSEHPMIVSLSPDGTRLRDAYRYERGRIVGREESCGAGCFPAQPPSPTSVRARERSGFVSTYSAALGTVFVAGGRDDQGEPLHDIVWQDIESQDGWHEVPVPADHRLGRIVDMTWSYADATLWVLDEIEVDERRAMRLSRINPFGGATSEIGVWPRTDRFLRHWLVADHDRQVMLAASNDEEHVLARFPVDDPWRLNLLRVVPGRLFTRPNVSAVGYTFVMHQGQERMPGLRVVDSLTNGAADWSDLEGCF